MNTKLLNIETISQYNEMLGIETLNPLVSVIDLSTAKPMRHMRHTFSFYVVFLKDEKNCELINGRQRYDYQPKGWALCFDPELIRGTSLGRNMFEYSFFSYDVNEALHLSESERRLFVDCLEKIKMELENKTDRLSKRLIATNIELLLDYCLRFYERQFVTREPVNRNILVRFETLLEEYFSGGKAVNKGLPSVKYCASELCLSAGYFGDLIKKETGISAQTYIQNKVINIAKERILNPMYSITQVAYELGFQYPQHFTRLFKKVTGKTPKDYKSFSL